MQFIVLVDDVDARVREFHLGRQARVGGIEQVGDECQLVGVAMGDDVVVLPRQFDALLPGAQLFVRLAVTGVPCVYDKGGLLACILGNLLVSAGGKLLTAKRFRGFEQGRQTDCTSRPARRTSS